MPEAKTCKSVLCFSFPSLAICLRRKWGIQSTSPTLNGRSSPLPIELKRIQIIFCKFNSKMATSVPWIWLLMPQKTVLIFQQNTCLENIYKFCPVLCRYFMRTKRVVLTDKVRWISTWLQFLESLFLSALTASLGLQLEEIKPENILIIKILRTYYFSYNVNWK